MGQAAHPATLELNRQCASASSNHSAAVAQSATTNYGIKTSMRTPTSQTIVDWSKGNFVNQEEWEYTRTSVSWIEAGYTDGDQYFLPSHYLHPENYTGWFWADESAGGFFSYDFMSAPTNSNIYIMYITPVTGTHTWDVTWKESKSSAIIASGTQSGSQTYNQTGDRVSFGIENTCLSNTWAAHDQRIGQKVKTGTSTYSWTTFRSTMASHVTGGDTYFHWITRGKKFSAGT